MKSKRNWTLLAVALSVSLARSAWSSPFEAQMGALGRALREQLQRPAPSPSALTGGLPCDEIGADSTARDACEALLRRGLDWRKAKGYQMLEVLFEEAKATTPAFLQGWRAGRRFKPVAEGEEGLAEAVLMGSKAVAGDGGPLTGPLYKVVMFFGYDPELVDAPSPEWMASIKGAYEHWRAASLPEFGEKEAVYKSRWDDRPMRDRTYAIRQFGSWLILKYAGATDGTDPGFYCYFFKLIER